MTEVRELSATKCFGGTIKKFEHRSECTNTAMKFNAFIPPNVSEANKAPVLYWLSGLTCTEDNFFQKSSPYQAAIEHGLVLVGPDTSPRGTNLPGDKDSWDFGEGAGFYVDATREPWNQHYRMYSYVRDELPRVVESVLPVTSARSIAGHSMGGHGALIIFLKNPDRYHSVSAFAPIVHPSSPQCKWGTKAFTGYLGDNHEQWKQWDATELVKQYSGKPAAILVDQGSADNFMHQSQLLPDDFVEAAKSSGGKVSVEYRLQDGYDHSYYFIATFIADHIQHAAKALKAGQ